MTAFARQQAQFDWGSAGWEIRSVNHRYLEPSFKLPESARNLEGPLREILRAHLSRGKIDIGLRLQLQPNTTSGHFALDDKALAAIIDAAESVYGRLQNPAPINPLEILQWPGVLAQTSTEESKIETQLLSSFQQTITQLLDSRAREGAVLAQFIEQRLIKVTDIIASVRRLLPEILSAQRQKLKDRLAELKSDLDNDRLEQEMVILAQKADVDEELDRLSTHVEEVTRVIKKGGHCGRRLDFLMQELNREANTLSSKSIVSETTQAAVELKVLIEQMREQIQNIE